MRYDDVVTRACPQPPRLSSGSLAFEEAAADVGGLHVNLDSAARSAIRAHLVPSDRLAVSAEIQDGNDIRAALAAPFGLGHGHHNDRMSHADAARVPAPRRAALLRYLAELDRWNQRLNLTTVPADQAWERHAGEALQLLEAASPQPAAGLIDIGSGTGVPGLVIAIARPDLRVTLLEADTRKAAFLTHVAGLLGLENVTVEGRRAEEAGHDRSLREAFDLAVSRATAAPPVLCELALPFVRVGGGLWALVTDAAAAVAACAVAARLCGGVARAAGPEVLHVEKVAPTPETFPRRPGIPTRRPLTTRG
jgi:16S rRNA (guanine527-N7)-methyltransferase